MREKLTIFPYGQCIIGIDGLLARSKLGLREICKNVVVISRTNRAKQQRQAAIFYANVVMATIASLPGVHLFCVVWAILASLWEHLTCRCLRVVRSSLIALRYV